MKESVYIYHHLGVGDTLLCNGLVRTYAKEFDKVFVFSFPHNAEITNYMYRDNPSIQVLPMAEPDIRSWVRINEGNENVVVAGHSPEYFRKLDVEKAFTFEAGFYETAGIPLMNKWKEFYVERNYEAEEKAFELAGIKKGEVFNFVHDDPERHRNFRPELIDRSVKTIHPAQLQEIKIFDFRGVLEAAKEIHVHNSSFANFIDTIELDHDGLYYHKYARTDVADQTFSPKVKWNFID